MSGEREALVALAERCERATGPDRELDAKIAVAAYPSLNLAPSSDGRWYGGDARVHVRIEDYVTSIDAALMLVPQTHRLKDWHERNGGGWTCWLVPRGKGGGTIGNAATPALALAAAALRARAEVARG